MKKALKSARQARNDFEQIDEAVEPGRRDAWALQEQQAISRRGTDPSSMDVFLMRTNKGTSLKFFIDLEAD